MFGASEQNAEDILAQVPEELPVLPLRNMVAFPFTMMPIAVGVPRSVKLVQEAMHGNRLAKITVYSLSGKLLSPSRSPNSPAVIPI